MEGYIIDIRGYADPLTDKTQLHMLGEYRQQKILRYKAEDDRRRSLVAGLLIQHFLKTAGKEELDLRYNEFQKPYVDGLYFNVSHSGNYVVGVMSRDCNVACDIERIKTSPSLESVARHSFSERELAYLAKSKDQTHTFYEIWTRKESLIKLRGGSIAAFRDLDLFAKEALVKLSSQVYDGHMVSIAAGEPFPDDAAMEALHFSKELNHIS